MYTTMSEIKDSDSISSPKSYDTNRTVSEYPNHQINYSAMTTLMLKKELDTIYENKQVLLNKESLIVNELQKRYKILDSWNKNMTGNKRKAESSKIDSADRSSCHNCKVHMDKDELVFCTYKDPNKVRKCRKKFCHRCLERMHISIESLVTDNGITKCPACRYTCSCSKCNNVTKH
jgi:hypothetical protein